MKSFQEIAEIIPDPTPWPDELAARNEENEFDPPARDDVLALAQIPPEAIGIILRLIFPSSRKADQPGFYKTAQVRLCALGLYVDPEVRALSQSTVARCIGVTKQTLNVEVVRLRDAFNLDHRAGCCTKAREIFKNAQLASWEKRHARKGKELVTETA